MQLKRCQARLHASRMTGSCGRRCWQEEYDKLSLQIQHYYASRKQLLEQRKRKGAGALRRGSGCSWNIVTCGMASSLPNATGVACWPASPGDAQEPDHEDRPLAVFLCMRSKGEK